MLAASAEPQTEFTRRDAGRLFAASVVLIAAMSVILGLDFLPAQPRLEAGRPAPTLVQAPRTDQYVSDDPHPAAARRRQRRRSRRSTTSRSAGAAAVATQQLRELDTKVAPIEAAFAEGVKPADRDLILQTTLPGLSSDDRTTLTGLDKERWTAIRAEAARVLETIERAELRDSEVAPIREAVAGRMAGDLNADETRARRRPHRPLIAPNSSFSADLTAQKKAQAAEDVAPVLKSWEKGETIVRSGDRVDDLAFEAIDLLRPERGRPRRRAARSASSCCRCSSSACC